MLKIAVTFLAAAASWMTFGFIDTATETEEHKLERQKSLYKDKLGELKRELKEAEKNENRWEECADIRDHIFEIEAQLKQIEENGN